MVEEVKPVEAKISEKISEKIVEKIVEKVVEPVAPKKTEKIPEKVLEKADHTIIDEVSRGSHSETDRPDGRKKAEKRKVNVHLQRCRLK